MRTEFSNIYSRVIIFLKSFIFTNKRKLFYVYIRIIYNIIYLYSIVVYYKEFGIWECSPRYKLLNKYYFFSFY